MKVLIFGGAGFIGRSLANALHRRGDEVCIVDDFSVTPEARPDKGVELCRLDISDFDNVRSILHEKANDWKSYKLCLMHAKQGYHKDYQEYGRINVLSAYALHEAISAGTVEARELQEYGVDQILLASSQAIYEPGLDVMEGSWKMPPSVYGMTKYQQERYLAWLCHRSGVPIALMRYSIVLGYGQALQSSESGIMRNWLRDWREGRPLCVYGSGEHIRDFVSIDDVTAANVLALDERLTGPLNVYGFPSTVLGLAEIFSELTGAEIQILGRDVRPGGEYTLTSSTSSWSPHSWKPKVDLEGQVRAFLDFAKERGETPGAVIPG